MLARTTGQPLKCRVGLHRYGPDHDAGYPYQRCIKCGNMGIYDPNPVPTTWVCALLR